MPTQYVTIKNTDSLYNQYMWGTFSKTQVAVPVKSYNLGTEEESVTFEIKNKADVARPGVLSFLSNLIKLKSYIIIAMPLFFVMAKNANLETFDVISVLSAALGLVLLFAGFNIRNDVADHVSGFDRVNLDSSKKPIRLGWITAKKSLKLSNLLIVGAAIIALPSVLLNLSLGYVLAPVVVLFFVGKLAKNNSYKKQHFGELVLFFLSGPALLAGLQIAAGGKLDRETFFFGLLWGLFVLFLVEVNNFSHIMTSSQNKILNTVTKLGFDRARVFLILLWDLIACALIYFQKYTGSVLVASLTITVALGSCVIFIFSVADIQSPMGSGLQKIKQKANKLFLACTSVLFLQSLDRWLQGMQ